MDVDPATCIGLDLGRKKSSVGDLTPIFFIGFTGFYMGFPGFFNGFIWFYMVDSLSLFRKSLNLCLFVGFLCLTPPEWCL